MRERLEGLIAAPFTPMLAGGALNLEAIAEQAGYLERGGVSGAFVCGTTGESLSMTVAERMSVARRWIDSAPEGFKVIVHVGHNSLEASKDLAAHAQEMGAWGTGAMGPCFFEPSLEGLVEFCAEMAAAAPDLPYYYYHMPSMTGVAFPMLDFLRAAGPRIPNLAGVKYTHEDLMDYDLCRRLDGGRFDMVFGRDEILLCALALGAEGAIGSTFNYMPRLYLELIEAFESGNLEAARSLQNQSMEIIQIMSAHGGAPVAGKFMMTLAGVDCGPSRLPLHRLTDQEKQEIEAQLRHAGFFDYCG